MSSNTNIPKSKLDIFQTREEVALRKLAKTAFDQVALDTLVDVDIASPDNNDGLFYNLSLDQWENDSFKTVNGQTLRGTGDITITTSGALSGLSDVTITTPLNNQVLTYNGSLSRWENQAVPAPSLSLDGLTDVAITTPLNKQVLTYVTATNSWVNETPAFPSLDELTDVTVTGPLANRQVIQYDSIAGTWQNQQPIVGYQGVRNSQEERLLGWGQFVDSDGTAQLITLGPGFAFNVEQLDLNLKTVSGQSVIGSGNVALSDTDVPATVVTEAGTSRAMANSDAGTYIRFTSGSAKTATFGTGLNVTGQEFHLRNVGANDLTLTPSSTTLNAPAGGTLVIPPGGTVTVKQVGATEFDVFGTTTAA